MKLSTNRRQAHRGEVARQDARIPHPRSVSTPMRARGAARRLRSRHARSRFPPVSRLNPWRRRSGRRATGCRVPARDPAQAAGREVPHGGSGCREAGFRRRSSRRATSREKGRRPAIAATRSGAVRGGAAPSSRRAERARSPENGSVAEGARAPAHPSAGAAAVGRRGTLGSDGKHHAGMRDPGRYRGERGVRDAPGAAGRAGGRGAERRIRPRSRP